MALLSTKTNTICMRAFPAPMPLNSDDMIEQLKQHWLKSANYRIIFLSMICAAAVALLPVQHYINLARFQKYGMAILVFGCGYFLQLLWSWRKLQKWARASNITTAVFFTSVGIVFYENPWLDTHVSVQTDDRTAFRYCMLGGYFVFSLIIAFVWYKWHEEDGKQKSADTKGNGTK